MLSWFRAWVVGIVAFSISVSTAQAQSLSVSATAGATTPDWAAIGEETITPVSSSISSPPSFVSGPSYMWSYSNVLQSSNPPPSDPPTSNYYAYFEDPNSPSTNFRATMYGA